MSAVASCALGTSPGNTCRELLWSGKKLKRQICQVGGDRNEVRGKDLLDFNRSGVEIVKL